MVKVIFGGSTILVDDIMISISQPQDKLTSNFVRGLAVLLNARDDCYINSESPPNTIEVINKGYKLHRAEEIYLEFLNWIILEDGVTWQFRLSS